MSSEVKANKVSPATGTDFTFGDSGDTFTVPSGATLTVASGGTITNSGTATGFGGDNTPSFFAYMGSNFTSSYATWQKLPMNSEHWDTDSAYDSTTNYRFTVPSGEAGKYSFTTRLKTSDHAAGTDMTHNGLYLNGVLQAPTIGTNEGGAQYVRYTTTTYLTLAVSDYVEMYVYTTSNNSLVFKGGSAVSSEQCWFEGHKLVGV
jgi:hypothetical protein